MAAKLRKLILSLKEGKDMRPPGKPESAPSPLGGIAADVQGQEELRVKVAEWWGWEFPIDLPAQRAAFMGYRYYGPEMGSAEDAEVIPDYCNDLNACASFVDVMDAPTRIAYEDLLIKMHRNYPPHAIHATAEARCQAFVATMEAQSKENNGN
jgi:hypothetical protein